LYSKAGGLDQCRDIPIKRAAAADPSPPTIPPSRQFAWFDLPGALLVHKALLA